VQHLPQPLWVNFPDDRQFWAEFKRLGTGRRIFFLRNEPSCPPITNIRNTSSPHWRGWLSVILRCYWYARRCRAAAIGRGDQHLRPSHMLLRAVTVPDDRLEPAHILRRDGNGDTCSHAESMNCFGSSGNPLNEPIH
jgi:hypothetical protein